MSHSQKIFPETIDLKNKSIRSGEELCLVATKIVTSSGCHIEGTLTQIAGAQTIEEANKIKQTINKARDLVKKQGLKLFGSSMRIQILLGKSTLIETFTPDTDGYIRDPNNNIGTGNIMNFSVGSTLQFESDTQSAMDDPEHNYKIISAIKMR